MRLKRKSTTIILQIRQFKWSFSTRNITQYNIEKQKSTKYRENLFPRAPKRKTTDRLIQLDRRKSASAVKVETENQLQIRNRAHQATLFGQVSPKKPYVNKINRGKRLNFAKEMIEKLCVISSDQCKFNLFRSDGLVDIT